MPFTKPARVRFAPSPTGSTHIGSGRTALYNYLIARQTGGQFILRIEDTDTKRFVPGAEEELIAALRWLGLDWDEGPDVGGPHAPYHQSKRKQIYLDYAHQLVAAGQAYFCFCTSERLESVRQEQQHRKEPIRYDQTCRRLDLAEAAARAAAGERHVIRFKMPLSGAITVHDQLRGDITVENRNLDDYILVKSDGLALYHLAAMVDDRQMGITHVIRGSEWLPTFPLHMHIIRALGWDEPEFFHLSLFLKPSGKGKMSKRETAQAMKDGYSIFIKDLEQLGYLPEAVVNWIALMGWALDGHTEFFTLAELVEKFDTAGLNPSPAAINFSKLDHFNGLHIRALPPNELARRLQPYFAAAGIAVSVERLRQIVPVIRERLVTLDEAPQVAGLFFADAIHPDSAELVGKHLSRAQALEILQRSLALLEPLPELTPAAVEPPMRALVEHLGLSTGQVFGVLRVAVTGQTVSPPLFESMEIFGKEVVVGRIRSAIMGLESGA